MFASSRSLARSMRAAGVAGLVAVSVLVVAPPARAATTTLYAASNGTGSACSAAQPCSLSAAQTAVRSLVSGMSGDIVDAVEAAGLGSLDKRTIELSAPIKAVGRHEATVRLRTDVVATITLEVVAAK